jgi:chitinase
MEFANFSSASFVFDAVGSLTFAPDELEFFAVSKFGPPFTVPGVVTVGPDMKVVGQLSGTATIHAYGYQFNPTFLC